MQENESFAPSSRLVYSIRGTSHQRVRHAASHHAESGEQK